MAYCLTGAKPLFEYVIGKMAAILSWPQWANQQHWRNPHFLSYNSIISLLELMEMVLNQFHVSCYN